MFSTHLSTAHLGPASRCLHVVTELLSLHATLCASKKSKTFETATVVTMGGTAHVEYASSWSSRKGVDIQYSCEFKPVGQDEFTTMKDISLHAKNQVQSCTFVAPTEGLVLHSWHNVGSSMVELSYSIEVTMAPEDGVHWELKHGTRER